MEAHVQPIVVALTLAARRPVKLILNREEDFQMVRARHPFKVHCKTGVRSDGTFVAREVDVLADCGAYGDDSPGVLGYSLLMARGPYRIPHTRCAGRLVYTNKMRFGAFRGFGNPQVSFAGETQIDEIAARLGIDPLEIRLKNALRGDEPWFGGTPVASNGLVECCERARSASAWDTRSQRVAATGKRRGLGVACTAHISGLLASGAIVRVMEDASIVLNTGTTDIGQGSDTVLMQMCADTLKIPLDRIRLASPDTDGSPFSWGTTASRTTYTTGRAVVKATDEVVAQLKRHASEMLEVSVDDLELRAGGRVAAVGSPASAKEVSFHEISLRAHWRSGGPIVGTHTWVFDRPTVDPKRAIARGLPFPQIGVFSFGCTIVDVEVDEVTGKPVVREAWSAMDVGKAINPASVEVQIEGGFVQGMGYALSEEMVWHDFALANPTLMDYKVPTVLDAPHDIHSIIVESPEPDGPYGAKGVGEITLNAVAPAIANAVADATGVRIRRLPLSPERVLSGMLEDAT
jgi:CO/xanthine dehydrogenase Mo-binding subunit